jgi:hypothetical protein
MKKLSILVFLALIFSCGGNSSEKAESDNILENLTYAVDTLLIQTNGEVINLGNGFFNFSLSPDKESIFYFDRNRTILQEIDLEKLELTNQFSFMRDGPNSIGFNPPQTRILPNDRILISTHGFGVNVFGINGEKQKSYTYNFKEIEGLDYDEGGLITSRALISEDEKRLFSLSRLDPSLSEVKLIVVNTEQKNGKTISLPAMSQVLKSIMIWRGSNSVARIGGIIDLQIIADKLFVYSNFASEVYQYDYQVDSLKLIEFEHQLVPNKKTGDFKNEISDEKEFYELAGNLMYQITFEKLLWDDDRNLFFRFASIPKPDQERKWYEEAEVFLFAYDSNLNLLGEIFLPDIKKVPDFPFFKDGKLWSCVNVEDELRFAVMDFKF